MSADSIFVWEDDPESGLAPIQVDAPDIGGGPLPAKVTERRIEPRLYDKNTDGFRYWAAVAAISRAAQFWGPLLPRGTTWERGSTLDVNLDRGEDLNAYYDRDSLSFFHEQVGGQTFYSCESPDVVCHEFGHGVLDAVRPELFNAASIESAAFHESFGDMSALLTALQLDGVRKAVLEETGNRLERSSRLSRLAEQLGRAIRTVSPDSADPDCLRNAANSFAYQAPDNLPSMGPASTISTEAHSFSRIFTGAFLEAFAAMYRSAAPAPDSNGLKAVSADMARLLLRAVQIAPVVPEFYAQVAAGLVQADAEAGGKYAAAIKGAFTRRGILSMQSAMAAASIPAAEPRAVAPAAASQAASEKDLPMTAIPVDQYGLAGPLFVFSATQARRLSVRTAALDAISAIPRSSEHDARLFVEHLMRNGHVDFGQFGNAALHILHPHRHKTHILERHGAGFRLVRKLFYCGFGVAAR